MNDKVLVNLYVPLLEKKYEVFLPASKKIGTIIPLIGKALCELSAGHYVYLETENLYNRVTGNAYNLNDLLKFTDIRNGTDLVFI